MTDTERLDWLEANRCSLYRSSTFMKRGHWVVVNETENPRMGNVGDTLRHAIDRALDAAHDGQPKEKP